MSIDVEARRKHAWISNAAFARMTGIVKVCVDCGLGLEKGERLTAEERYCIGKRATKDTP
jgi:hypothetical protein